MVATPSFAGTRTGTKHLKLFTHTKAPVSVAITATNPEPVIIRDIDASVLSPFLMLEKASREAA
jgi:hypothetical protein